MPKTKGIPFEDVYKRVNFLYQAACQSLLRNPEDLGLCRFYINTLMVIARRQGIQLHPDLKRKMCKRCCVILTPGLTAIYRVKKKRQKQTVVTCLGCGTLRRFVYNNKMVPWVDRPEAWVDTVVKGQFVTVQQQGKTTLQQQGKAKGSKQVHNGSDKKQFQTKVTEGSTKEEMRLKNDTGIK